MSYVTCEECERLVDTDFEEGYWDNCAFFCDNCADKLGYFDEETEEVHPLNDLPINVALRPYGYYKEREK